jgi:hypothetical protein
MIVLLRGDCLRTQKDARIWDTLKSMAIKKWKRDLAKEKKHIGVASFLKQSWETAARGCLTIADEWQQLAPLPSCWQSKGKKETTAAAPQQHPDVAPVLSAPHVTDVTDVQPQRRREQEGRQLSGKVKKILLGTTSWHCDPQCPHRFSTSLLMSVNHLPGPTKTRTSLHLGRHRSIRSRVERFLTSPGCDILPTIKAYVVSAPQPAIIFCCRTGKYQADACACIVKQLLLADGYRLAGTFRSWDCLACSDWAKNFWSCRGEDAELHGQCQECGHGTEAPAEKVLAFWKSI